jgi:outer membrane protein W
MKKMKSKKAVFILTLTLLLLGAENLVWAERFSVHANGGFFFPREGNMKSGWESGFGFAYILNKKVAAFFDFGFWKSEVEEEPGELFNGKLSVTPFLFSLQYYFFEKRDFIPYIFAGIGYIFYDFKLKDIFTIPEITITQKIENGLGFQAGLGAQVKILDRLSIFGEALYLYRKAEGTTTTSDLNFGTTKEEFSLDTSTSLIRLGIRYFF